MNDRLHRAIGAAADLARVLAEFDPQPSDGFLVSQFATTDGIAYGLTLSEAGVEQLTQLLTAHRRRQPARPIRHLSVVRDAS
ncbi:hypothetical protein [Streptomyces sp. NPDC014793]|uniref:hypothetical protein n=1 Tax=Streptomyces sp. NPDC014793 TaxID=3364914 RepID=UPI0036F54CE5